MGGLSAVVRTDILQGIFIAVILIASLFFLDINQVIAGIQQVAEERYQAEIPWQDWVLMPMLFVIIGQDMSQRCFAASNPKLVSYATASSGIFLGLLSLIPVVLGMQAREIFTQEMAGSQSVLMTYMMMISTPSFSALFAVAILMAILSTMDSLICSISSNISYDILPMMGARKKQIWLSRAITFGVGGSAMILSIGFEDIIGLMVQAYKFSIYTLFLPILLTAYGVTKKAWQVAFLIASGMFFFFL